MGVSGSFSLQRFSMVFWSFRSRAGSPVGENRGVGELASSRLKGPGLTEKARILPLPSLEMDWVRARRPKLTIFITVVLSEQMWECTGVRLPMTPIPSWVFFHVRYDQGGKAISLTHRGLQHTVEQAQGEFPQGCGVVQGGCIGQVSDLSQLGGVLHSVLQITVPGGVDFDKDHAPAHLSDELLGLITSGSVAVQADGQEVVGGGGH